MTYKYNCPTLLTSQDLSVVLINTGIEHVVEGRSVYTETRLPQNLCMRYQAIETKVYNIGDRYVS